MLARCITSGWRVRLAEGATGRHTWRPGQTATVMASLKRVRTMNGNAQRAAAVVSCLMTMKMKKQYALPAGGPIRRNGYKLQHAPVCSQKRQTPARLFRKSWGRAAQRFPWSAGIVAYRTNPLGGQRLRI